MRRHGDEGPMSNSVDVFGRPLSVAELMYEKLTGGRAFVPKLTGPRTADEALDAMNRPTDDRPFLPGVDVIYDYVGDVDSSAWEA